MPFLLVVSLIWAFSPGLTKGLLTGIDGSFVAAARLGLALLVFLPWLRLRGLPFRTSITLIGIGAVQFGLMYLAYNESLRLLPAYAVALGTITTPIFVTLLADACDRTLRLRALGAALLAVAGVTVVIYRSPLPVMSLHGMFWVQVSNLAFAAGQVWYRRMRAQPGLPADHQLFGLLYLGAFAFSLGAVLVSGTVPTGLSTTQLATLGYLGVIASGLGFFLWNLGATRVNAGTLAVMNNAKVPLMVACSLVFFHESADPMRLLLSLAFLGTAVWLAEKR